MGQEKETKTRDDPKVEIQERGEIFFFYRPKVYQEEPRSANDVQNMYIVLRPESGERKVQRKQPCDCEPGQEGAIANELSTEKHDEHQKNKNESEDHDEGHGSEKENVEKPELLRLIVLGRKCLPKAAKRSRPYWGYVELVTTNREDLAGVLCAGESGTATRGSRAKPAAKALARGMYRILRHYPAEKGMHTHLVYKLEQPSDDEKQEPQEALNVEEEGSFIIQIKNPEKASPPSSGLQSKRKASFPARLQGQFGSSRFVSADPPDFLNYEGCEFILMSASDDMDAELGLQTKTADDVDAELGLDMKDGVSCSPDLVVMKMFEETVPVEPLLHGTRA